MQAEQEEQAAAQAETSASRLNAGQLQRLKQRNQELMQRKAEAAAARRQETDQRLARLHAIQEQVRVCRCCTSLL